MSSPVQIDHIHPSDESSDPSDRQYDERIPKQLLHRKRFKDTLKTSLSSFSIDTSTWEQLAANHTTLRKLIYQGLSSSKRKTDPGGPTEMIAVQG